jgi:membrane-bound lytic murein transglycosylase B
VVSIVAGSPVGRTAADAAPVRSSATSLVTATGAPWSASGTLGVDDPSSTVLAELNVVPVRGPQLDAALAANSAALAPYFEAVAAEERAIAEHSSASERLDALRASTIRLEVARALAVADLDRVRTETAASAAVLAAERDDLEQARAVLDGALIDAYVSRGGGNDPTDPDAAVAMGRRAQYLEHVIVAQFDEVTDRRRALEPVESAHAAALARQARHEAALRLLGTRLAGLATAAVTAVSDLERAATALDEARSRRLALGDLGRDAKLAVAEARRTAVVVGADFPLVLLDAFVRAARYEAVARPGCRLDWPLLAALSKAESNHGTYGGSSVDAFGQTSAILGPPLDPTSGFAVISDSDGGELDGDPRYDRAVGPMQFLPSSWRAFALDGNGDGVIDPRNYYDAALAAAEHLCRGGADTGTDAGRRAALFGYNGSSSYVGHVLAIRERYLTLGW